MIEIEILLTFVYFLECTVVQCKIEIVANVVFFIDHFLTMFFAFYIVNIS